MRWILLILSAASAALGLLTVFPIPDWLDWRLTVLAGGFGAWLSVIPLGAALASLAMGRRAVSIAACALGALGFILLARPCLQARAIARDLPDGMASAFGAARVEGEPFLFARLFAAWPDAPSRRVLTYSDDLKLDFYQGKGASAPCVVVIHGGGWDSGERGQIPTLDHRLAGLGYAVADIDYRLAPDFRWPAQREDVARAIAYLKNHAQFLGVDPERLFLLGRSAGGQIAEACAYGLHDPSIRGVIALYAPADMRFAWAWSRPDDALNSPRLLRRFLGGSPDDAPRAYDDASAIALVDAQSPPTLLVHGSLDTLVWNRQSQRLTARLTAAGVSHFLLEIPWAGHALELNPDSPSGQLSEYAIARFLAARCR